MPTEAEMLSARIARNEFLLQLLWVEEFSRRPNPLTAARAYADSLSARVSAPNVPEIIRTIGGALLDEFFDGVIARLQKPTQRE
jgi:hypothetical protein